MHLNQNNNGQGIISGLVRLPTSAALSQIMNTPLLQLQPALPAIHLDATQPTSLCAPTLNEPEPSCNNDLANQNRSLQVVKPWKSEVQIKFAANLCRLLLVSNIAWWAVDQPYWHHFFRKWMCHRLTSSPSALLRGMYKGGL